MMKFIALPLALLATVAGAYAQAGTSVVARVVVAGSPTLSDPMSFWNHPQHGSNSFNESVPDQAYFNALRKTGATWVRLTFSKWHGKDRDFLIGNADRYVGIPADDLRTLTNTLDRAHLAGLKVVVVPLSLPGVRWIQQNKDVNDDRLWSSYAYWKQAADFWRDLATVLRKHPAIAAYNILNEPVPEKSAGLGEHDPLATGRAWQLKQAGTPRDLAAFYNVVIAAIREVDGTTPIMVDSGTWANARSLATWAKPLDDAQTLYAVHMYSPYKATSLPNLRAGFPWRYPGVTTRYDGGRQVWNAKAVKAHVGAAFDWAQQHEIPPSRVVVSEFGCVRLWQDCGAYLKDVIDAVESRRGHWAFYGFREDQWDGMDYELPASVTTGEFYQRLKAGTLKNIRRNGPLMYELKRRMVQ